ncbi:MAG: FAD-dependent monooxygenase [Bdellovibrionota bacterium]|nr:FAD-dependent monooxygenase [Bdellovibrionota bacterium]
MTVKEEKYAIIGGGLVGSLMAIFLKRKGIDVVVFEKREDLRKSDKDHGRSINLIATSRGIHALKKLSLWDEIKKITVPVFGRMIHSIEEELTFQPYGKDKSECNYSVSRSKLNEKLISLAEKEGVRFLFNFSLSKCDFSERKYFFVNGNGDEECYKLGLVFAADGAGSQCRKSLMDHLRVNYSEKFEKNEFYEDIDPLESGYKEFFMPSDGSGNYCLDKDSLHIWPRGSYMFMTLANLKGSFTGTLYMPHQSEDGVPNFGDINNKKEARKLFKTKFPDAERLLPQLEEEFMENPTGKLGTVKCYPWYLEDKMILLGDAAHAIVPFFGQGMNCGFEDCAVLDGLMSDNEKNWDSLFGKFIKDRKENADAIADMALENFFEMKNKVGDSRFLLKKQIENLLEKTFPSLYRSRYAIVTYGLIDYKHAFELGKIQKELIDELSEGLDSKEQLNLAKAKKLIEEKITPYVKKYNLSFDF